MVAKQMLASFKPRARLVSILGEHLISDHVVGLLELVKNGYDADASRVRVVLKNLEDPATTQIVVEDDGFGMTSTDVVDKFLSPAVDHKARNKKNRKRTPRGRLPIGEKGVGRFAVQQLGHQLHLVTRAAGEPEVVVEINWDAFDNSEAFLHDLTFPVIEREPEVFKDDRTGTRLVISGARDEWTEGAVKKLQRGLRRLQSPNAEDGPHGKRDFQVFFSCPDYPQYESLDPGDILDRAHYVFRALVDKNGQMEYEYRACHPDPAVPERVCEANHDLVSAASSEIAGRQPACGPFYLNLYVWDRTAQYLQASGISRSDLDAMAGVSLFRDYLRVLPYGEPGDDWLHLDRDRINNPSERIGNNQVIGFVEVFQEETPGLRDKTNREGLIDNEAFQDLRTMVRAAIAYFNTLWQKDRPATKQYSVRQAVPAVKQLEHARSVASAIHQTARPDICVELPPSAVAVARELSTNGATGDLTATRVSQQEASRRLLSEIDRAIDAERREEAEQMEQRDVLLHLAATGIAAERVVHEFGRQVVAALDALVTIRQGGPAARSAVDVLEACLGTLRNEFRVLAPYEGVNRFQRAATIDVKEAVKIALLLNRHALDAGQVKVTVDGDGFEVLTRPASLIQVFDNLIHNASSWIQNGSSERIIRIVIDRGRRTVVVGDSGPGVSPDIAPMIFNPFVSTRPGGRGLGLYIVRELLMPDGGTVELCSDQSQAVASGANFIVDLSGYPRPDSQSRKDRGGRGR